MSKNIIHIEVKDCSYIEIDAEMALYINQCFTEQSVFRISDRIKEDEIPLLSYDYKSRKWLTGRYIGELNFQFKNQSYCLKVVPRFGDAILLHLLEEIFNVKLAKNKSDNKINQESQNQLIKKLISLIWTRELGKANVHGIPKHKINNTYVGKSVKGKLKIRESILPLYNSKQIVSEKVEKNADVTILTILQKAYKILSKDYFLTPNMLSDNVTDVLNHTQNYNTKKGVTVNDYKKIKYGAIYESFRAVVDFSWAIIQRKNNSITQKNSDKDTDALFLDIAEIWESYLLSILKKTYTTKGWKVFSKKFYTYKSQNFKRGLIPDIILEKDDNVVVWDAKYKNMEFRSIDYDRNDFFQIHTYGAYMKAQNKNVIGLGLLYPFNKELNPENERNNYSSTLFGVNQSDTWFKVDGIKLSGDIISLEASKEAFLSRINKQIINA